MTLNDQNLNRISLSLWETYDSYTNKFELHVYQTTETLTNTVSGTSYNARSYGILHTAYLGF